MKTKHDQDKLNRAFKAMRKWGLVARQNYQCCQGCGGAAIATELGDKIAAGKLDPDTIKGAVFYHRQDADSRDEGLAFHLSFGPVSVHREGAPALELGGTAEEVGNTVCEILSKFKIPFEWNGEPGTRIKVIPFEVAA